MRLLRRYRAVVVLGLAVLALVPAGAAQAQVPTAEVEHAEVEDLFPVSDLGVVTGVSDDDRYVLAVGDGAYRYDVELGSRVRVDVFADGTPVDHAAYTAYLSDDGTRALSVLFEPGSDLPRFLLRDIEHGFTRLFDIPDPHANCSGSHRVEDVTPDLSTILVRHVSSVFCPVSVTFATHIAYRLPLNGALSSSEFLRNRGFWGQLTDDGGRAMFATGGCAPGTTICSYSFGTVDRTLVMQAFPSTGTTSLIRSDIDGRGRGDGFAAFTGDGTKFMYGSRLKDLAPGSTVITGETYALYRGRTETGALRYLTGVAASPLHVDRSGRFVLALVTVVAPDGTETINYAVVDTWGNAADVRVLDLTGGICIGDCEPRLFGDLSSAAVDRDLRYAFRIRDVDDTPTLQRVSLAADEAGHCVPGDTNCDGWVRIAVLGDSYISGEGAADGIDNREPPVESKQPYHSCTDIVDEGSCGAAGDGRSYENKCHRSDASWGMRVAKELSSGTDILFPACSGAKTGDILDYGQWDGRDGRGGPSPPDVFGGEPQIDVLADFQAHRAADVVLLSVGGNDVKFGPVVSRCLLTSCLVWPASGWKGDAQREARTIGGRLAYVIDEIRDTTPTAHVYIAGYPDPTGIAQCGATGLGTSLLSVDAAEQQWLRDEFIGPLNRSVQEAAEEAGATFVPFQHAFSGHEICTDLAYANGLKASNDLAESFHPNAFGHRRLAQIAATYVRGGDGDLEPEVTIPLAQATPLPTLDVATGTTPMTPSSSVDLQGGGAPPNSSGILLFNSLPTIVGQWSADAAGTWSAAVEIPANAAPGPHELSAIDPSTGRELASATVFVDTSTTCVPATGAPDVDADGMPDTCDPSPLDGPGADADGDGIGNAADNCATRANAAQQDADQNGLGDVCDPGAGASLEGSLRRPGNVPPARPEVTVDDRADSERGATVAVSGTDPDDAAETLVFRCTLNDGPATICTSPVRYSGLAAGTYTLSVTSGDPAGNRSSPATVSWRVTGGSSGAPSPWTPPRWTPTPEEVPREPAYTRRATRLRVLRATVRNGTLDVLARVNASATGRVAVAYRASGRTIRFSRPVANGTLRFVKRLAVPQRRKRTGTLTLSYAGDRRVRGDTVRVLAASRRSRLTSTKADIDGTGRLLVAGTSHPRARGSVRIRFEYASAGGAISVLAYNVSIRRGRYTLTAALPSEASASGGELSIRYAGDRRRRIAGAQLALPAQPGRS